MRPLGPTGRSDRKATARLPIPDGAKQPKLEGVQRARVPELAPGMSKAVQRLSLDAEVLLLLSYVDGRTSVAELADRTGLTVVEIASTLEKLSKQGVVRMMDPKEEDLDLTTEQRAEIDALFSQLPALDHYAVLGVERGADRKTVKRAYYERAASYHPDRFFRKRLGSYRSKMETIFARMTEASDALSQAAPVPPGGGATTRQAATPPPTSAVVTTATARPPESVTARARVTHARAEAESSDSLTRPARVTHARAEGESSDSLTERARRDLLAKRLRAGQRTIPPPSTPLTAPPSSQASGPPSDPTALRRMVEGREDAARRFQLERMLGEARAALTKGDIEAAERYGKNAANAIPEDGVAVRSLRLLIDAFEAELIGPLLERARTTELAGAWPLAARFWARAGEICPEKGEYWDRAALALLRSLGNLHEAAIHARRAIDCDPRNAGYHFTLAQIYMAAGLPKNAKRELEAAQQLAPHDGSIAAMMKRAGLSG